MQTTTTRALPQRDQQTLEHLAQFRFLERRQLQHLLYADTPINDHSAEVMTRRILQRLTQRKLITHTEQQPGGPIGGSNAPVSYLTPTGAQHLKHTQPAPRSPRGMLLVRHAIASADVVLAFDRAARAQADHELLGWTTDANIGRDLGPIPLLPDLYLTYATRDIELHAFVEVDLGSEGSRVIATKIDQYLQLWRTGTIHERLGLWPLVLWVTTNPTRARLLRGAIERVIGTQHDAHEVARGTEFAVATFDRLAEQGALGPIWQVIGRDERQPLLEPEVRS
jgi:Replication-relaxation